MSRSGAPGDGRFRVGLDIGGTFTDFVLLDRASGRLALHKRLTTPADPSEGALSGLGELVAREGLALADLAEIVHGTTLVTNALIERKGARLGLLTTAGFRDLLEMGTEQRYDIYDLFLERPEPLVPRDLRLEVAERVDALGRIVQPLDPGSVERAVERLAGAGCEAVAIVFLHAYANPAHERAAAAIVRRLCPDLPVSLSSEVAAQMGEYPRAVTTCVNAYAQPLVERYLRRFETALAAAGFRGTLRLVTSAAGLVSAETARAFPVRLLESGPAGGALATALVAARAGADAVIAFDMGGTTAKACLVEGGRAEIAPMLEAARVHRFTRGSGLPVETPVVDMIEIGAGGGSIAAIDEVGLLKVGPRSAGADPGPACYGLGGTAPTVTDANLVLGYYDPGFFLGGAMALDRAAARRAVAGLATPLGLEVERAALGIHAVVVEAMAAAVRVHLVEKGKDPRRCALVAFGGAGPAHAVEVARALGIARVLVPPASGAASALGFLAAPLSFEGVRSLRLPITAGLDFAPVEALFGELEAEGRARLEAAGVAPGDIRVERSADMRLVGQMHEIAVPLPEGRLDATSLPAIRAAFAAAYGERYTAVPADAAVEAVHFRVRLVGPEPALPLEGALERAGGGQPVKGRRTAWFAEGPCEVPVLDRYGLAPGTRIEGPAIVEEREATTVIGPGDRLQVDPHGNLVIAVGRTRALEPLMPPGTTRREAVARIERDPIGLEIMWSRLVNVVEEMWLTVCRTAFSLVISEAQDFACELLDRDGETLAHSPRAMPVFNLTLPRAVKALLERFPPATLRPGDVLVTNDPWLCAGHLFDIAVVTPVFLGGRLVGLTGTVGHVSDIGGTKDSLAAREIYEEGLQIPPLKLYEEGRPNATLFALIRENVRHPEQVLGDIGSFVAANAIGAARLAAFMEEYGLSDLGPLAEVVQGRSEAAMRAAIRALPDGVFRAEITNNPLGVPLRYPVAITVAGDRIAIDLAGAPPQMPIGGLNCTLNYTAAHATYPLKCMLTPRVRGNAGCYRPFTVEAPEGSILNCTRPAAVNLRTRTGWYLAPLIFRALAEAAPEAVQAFSGVAVAATIYGRDGDGRLYSDMLFCGGGQGASAARDGNSALLWPTSAANTSIERLEARCPVLVLEKTFVPGSGGRGRHRGGLGQRVRFRKREEDGLPMLVSVYPEGVDNPIPGLFGGEPGGGARGRVVDPSGRLLRDCGTGALVELTRTAEIVELTLAGGSGYGPPEAREPAAVARDRALGLVDDAAAGGADPPARRGG